MAKKNYGGMRGDVGEMKKALKSEQSVKMFGAPAKKMSPMQVQKRKRTMISNAAQKTFNSKYSR